ncbi:hypothetical protein LSM04_001687 [Trypanosoma melophagium]|nr:hypothetical protein LSM04_001687 [Trypanosoma melophagium]
MGGTMRYGVKSGHVTVTNVLLYNRELNQSEIKTLLAFKDTNVATAKKRPKEVLTETIPSLLPTPSLTESTTEGGVVPTQSKGIKPPMERVQSSGTDRISGGHTAGHGPKSGDVQKKSTDNNGPDSNGAPSAGKTTKSEITTGPGETVSVPSVSPVKEDDKKEEEDQSLRHGSTAQTNVNVMNGNDTFDRTGISSATHKSPSAVQPEKPESPTVVNHKDSVPDVTVEKEEDENKSNCDSDSSNRGTSIGIEKNEIKNNNPSEGSESTKEESPKNTMDASKEDTVTPTEATHQSIDVPNTYAHHVSKLSGADGSFYFNSSLPLIILLGSTLVVVLF